MPAAAMAKGVDIAIFVHQERSSQVGADQQPASGGLSISHLSGNGPDMEPAYIDIKVPGVRLTASQNQQGQLRPSPLASAGSVNHGDGTCKPCAWQYKGAPGTGCKNGDKCTYCHLCP